MTKRLISRRLHSEPTVDQLVSTLLETEERLGQLPPLSALEKATLDNEVAIEHLYYSSKIEGTTLTEPGIKQAIHAKTFSETEG